MKRRTLALSAVAAAVVIGAGTATTVAFAGDDGRSSHSDARAVKDDHDDRDRDRDDDHDATPASRLTADQAVAAALRHTAGTPAGADLDDSDGHGRPVWEVDVLTGSRTWHEIKVDPDTGKVIGSHVDRDDDGADDDDAREAALLRSASTSLSDAVRAASAKGRVTSVELDDDARAWEVETVSAAGPEHEWHVGLTADTLTPAHD